MNDASNLRFSAIPLGQAKLPASGQITQLFQLTADDLPYLKRGLKLFKATNGAMVPTRPGIQRDNHLELVEECFEKSIENLSNTKLKQHTVLIAATDDQFTLQGLSLNNLERTLPDGETVYSPFPDLIDNKQKAGHTSVNWLVSLHNKGGIGKQLLAAFKALLPAHITHIDTLSEIEPFSKQAVPLSEKMGFKALHHLQDAKPILQSPAKNPADVPTFRDMHGLPMRAERQNFDQKADAVHKQTRFVPATNKTPVSLSDLGTFPSYSVAQSSQ